MRSTNGRLAYLVRGRLAVSWQALACTIGLALSVPAVAFANSVRFDIPAQPLSAALQRFAAQSHMQLLYESSSVTAVTANAVSGELDTHAALELLLRGTGLEAVYSSQNGATIRPIHHTSATRPSPDTYRLAQVEAPIGADSPAPTARDAVALEEVVITAQKRAESLSRAPVAVTALNPEQMAAEGIRQVQDLTTEVPNVEIGEVAAYGNSVVISVRGIASSNFSEEGDPAVATYIDGVYVPRTSGLNGSLYDLERVELLRGPQGTLYGRNAMAGALNIITADPKDRFEAAVEASAGNYSDVEANGMLNIPLTDQLAVRGAFTYHRNDGYFDTQGTTARNYGAADSRGARLTGLWHPNDTFKWRLSFEDYEDSGTEALMIATGPNGQPADGLPVYNRPVNSSPEPALNLHIFSVRSRLDWDISHELSLTYVSGYQDLVQGFAFGFEGAVGPTGVVAQEESWFQHLRNENYTNEINLNYDSRRIKNTFGAAAFHENTIAWNQAYYDYLADLDLIGIEPPMVQDAWGVFDQATLSITDNLRITGGLRYSHDEKEKRGWVDYFCPAATPLSVSFAAFAPNANLGNVLAGCSSTNISGRGAWSGTTWKSGIDYDFSANTFGYLSVTTGFKEGGLNDLPPGTPMVAFSPEKATNYEIGLKSRQLNGRLSLNAALFYENYTNLQINQLFPIGNVTVNAGRAAIKGIETEAQWRITSADRLDTSFNYLSARYTNYLNVPDPLTGAIYPSLDGHYLPKAPELSTRLRYGHSFTLPNSWTLTPAANFYYQTFSYLREFNLPIDRVPAYTRTGLLLSYRDPSDQWLVEAFVNNLEDRAIRNLGFTISNYYSSYDAPRTFGVRVSYRFQ
jgi:iron complex outermembrane recepter protein